VAVVAAAEPYEVLAAGDPSACNSGVRFRIVEQRVSVRIRNGIVRRLLNIVISFVSADAHCSEPPRS
jgi:hypothetical protein